jgi:hypothetical protein
VTVYDWEGSNEDMDRRKGGSVSTVSTTSSSQDPYSLDEEDRQVALALSEEYQAVDREVANRLTKLESMKVCSSVLRNKIFKSQFGLCQDAHDFHVMNKLFLKEPFPLFTTFLLFLCLQHVLRTNQSFPTYEDASADHQRLSER